MTTAFEILKNSASHQVNPGYPDGELREFHPEGAYWANPDAYQLSPCDEDLLESMAACLRDAVEGNLDLSDALEIHVCRETGNPDNYVVRIVLTVGGPYVAIEYDSDDSSADIVGYWGGIAFCIREYGSEIAELCQELAAAEC
jgi:hypothetical protein